MTQILFITVGGSHQPIITSIQSLKPDRTIFICSGGSQGSISQVTGPNKPCQVRRGADVIETLANIPTQLNLGSQHNPETDVIVVDNPDDLSGFYGRISTKIQEIRQEFPSARLMADYTGGTKSMSIALAMAALDHQLELCLTTASRTDLIRVTRGESVRRTPVTDVAMQRLLSQVLPRLFAQYNYPAAIAELESFLRDNMLQNPEKLEFYLNLCRGLNYWDCFDHGEAWLYLEPYLNQPNLRSLLLFLKQVMGSRRAMDEQFLAPDSMQGHGYELVEDLVLNAERRAKMERYDDAVGRLYRALELLAQVHLWRRYEIKTGEVDLSKLPEALRAQYAELKKPDGKIQLALHSSYELLKQWPDDPLGAIYQESASRLLDQLQVRNYSILAHGLRSVTAQDYQERFQGGVVPFIQSGLKAVKIGKSRFIPVQFPTQIDF